MSNVPEIKTVVVYASDDIEAVLRKLDTETAVKGIDTMRNIVEVFDILKNNGSVQNAAVNHDDGEYVDPMFADPASIPEFVGEGEVVYNSDDVEEPMMDHYDSDKSYGAPAEAMCENESYDMCEPDTCENETPKEEVCECWDEVPVHEVK